MYVAQNIQMKKLFQVL